jgi:hypothetical protein
MTCHPANHQKERPVSVDLSVLGEITPELISEVIANCFPGMAVSVEAISEDEAKRRMAEGGDLFRS